MVDTQLIHEVLGLHNEGIMDSEKTYPVQSKIPSTGQMRQTKDVADPERRSQFQFYLHNIVHMAKNEDMSIKNYSRLRAAEEGVEINWAAIYLENLKKRAAVVLEKGGPTVVHAHLQALAQAAAKDPEARKQAAHRGGPMPVPHKTQPEPTPAVGGMTAGTSMKGAPASFKSMGNPEKANPFAKIEDMMSKKRRKIHQEEPGKAPQTEKAKEQQEQPQKALPKEPVQEELPQEPLAEETGQKEQLPHSKEKEQTNQKAQQKEQARQKKIGIKKKAQEGTSKEGTTTINLTDEPEHVEEIMVPPSGVDRCLEEAMKVMEEVNEFHRQGMLLHKHVDKIHKEAWDRLSAAQSRAKRCVSGYLQPAQDQLKDQWKEEREALKKSCHGHRQWIEGICEVKDNDRRTAIQASKELQQQLDKEREETALAKEQLNKQQEATALAKEQEKISREAQIKMQKLYEEARKDAQALPKIKARVSALEKDREKALADQLAIAKEKAELHRVMKVKDEVINALQQVTENWKQTMDEIKGDVIKSKAMEELLVQENRLLKQQEGEDKDVLLLTPQAKDTLMQALMETLSPTWDKALKEAYQIKQDIVSEVEQKTRGEESITAAELQKHRDEAAKWKKAFEDITSSAKTPALEKHKEEYWEKEAGKYKELYREASEALKKELSSTECINLIRETTIDNQKLKADNKKLIEEVLKFNEYKGKLNKFSQEQKKYVQDLELSIQHKQQKLAERGKCNDFPTTQDFAMEAEMHYEEDLLDQAKMLQDGGPEAFKPTLKITYENFKLKGQVKAMEQQLDQVRADADLIRKHDDDTIAAGKEKLTRGELVVMNRKLI